MPRNLNRVGTTKGKNEKTCKVCATPLALAAKKCPHCGSYQGWKAHLSFAWVVGSLVILVPLVLENIPIITNMLTPDDSDVSLAYIYRPDITIPIIVSNKGNRPAVMSSAAGLELTTADPAGNTKIHYLRLTPTDSSRENMFVLENTSKQIFFVVNLDQPIPNTFQDLATSLKTILHLKKCVVVVPYLDFRGQPQRKDLIIYDIEDKSNDIAQSGDRAEFVTSVRQIYMGAAGCIGKIPVEVKKKFTKFDEVLQFLP